VNPDQAPHGRQTPTRHTWLPYKQQPCKSAIRVITAGRLWELVNMHTQNQRVNFILGLYQPYLYLLT
jgi:hypothetical protein